MPRITSVLHLSTAHVDAETAAGLDAEGYDLPVYALGEYGWLVVVTRFNPGDPEFNLPASLQACYDLAQARGCDHIRFDRDEPAIGDLPTFDW